MMKHLLSQLVFVLMFLSLSVSETVQAQDETEITEGTDFWFGMPWCGRHSTEPVRWGTYPIEIWVTSKVQTQVTITSADGVVIPQQTYQVEANSIKTIQLPDALENRESEKITDKGIHITSADPIEVRVLTAYKWSGEAFRVMPTCWLGNEYFTLNLYQDSLKFYDGKIEARPAEILIVATQDSTEVTFKPKWNTKAGVDAGTLKTITLNKGQTYLILGQTVVGLTQDWITDLSGTFIKSNKPIAVISGHTKGAFPRFGVYALGLKSDFMRNMLMEMMWPVEYLGTEYISAPIKYNDRNFTDRNERLDSKGDLIRFVATQDSTVIFQMNAEGTELTPISDTINTGDVFNILSQEVTAYYQSNKPVLVGQYGKGWWLYNVLTTDGKEDETLNPSRNGQGMMLTLAPVQRWCGHSVFYSIAGMDAFFYMTFRTADKDKIKFDSTLIAEKFSTEIKNIPGTDYSYLASKISAGVHYLDATEKGVKFAAYAYGNWDQYKDGFAYGYPAGINYTTPCNDSVDVSDTTKGLSVIAKVKAVDCADKNCSEIVDIYSKPSKLFNYKFNIDKNFTNHSKSATYQLEVIDKKDSATAEIEIMTRSGKIKNKTYSYIPEKVEMAPNTINFGYIQNGKENCHTFTIKNARNIPANVKSLKFGNISDKFTIKNIEFPFVMNPYETREIEVCVIFPETGEFLDSLYAELSEFDLYIGTISGTSVVVSAKMSVGSAEAYKGDTVNIPINLSQREYFDITEISSVDCDLEFNGTMLEPIDYSATAVNKTISSVHLTNLPIALEELENIRFIAKAGTSEETDLVLQNIKINGGTAEIKTENGKFKLLTNSDVIDNEMDGIDYFKLSPNPAQNDITISFSNISLLPSRISIYNNLGHRIGGFEESELLGKSSVIFSTKELPEGIYYCTVKYGKNQFTKSFAVVK